MRRVLRSGRRKQIAATPRGPESRSPPLRFWRDVLLGAVQRNAPQDECFFEPAPLELWRVEARVGDDPEALGELDEGDVVRQLVGHRGCDSVRLPV